ncbi:MAG: quinolinate synthase NadA [Halobacteriales archaeon]|nr:quinolinate synthase NadA [Halobacteriales archaeon]
MSITDDAELSLWKYSDSLGALPEEYEGMPDDERIERTETALEELDDVVILGHNYQRHSVTQHADHLGDSLQLSRLAGEADARNVVFCGVTFMAETADIVTDDDQRVVMPSMEASCPMAGMAENIQVDGAWDELTSVVDGEDVTPVTYVNSYASLKAFTAEKGGTCCTSSNASDAFEWALEQGEKIFFTPDKHLAHNTLHELGYGDDDFVIWDPWEEKLGGNTPQEIRDATFILWEGFCQVHERFELEDVRETREQHPYVNVIVHPECRREVVEAADYAGSTSSIIEAVENAPEGSKWAIGTEIHLTKRLARENPDKEVFGLCADGCSDCNAMRQIDPDFLLYVLEEMVEGNVVNRIDVDEDDKELAGEALDTMLHEV